MTGSRLIGNYLWIIFIKLAKIPANSNLSTIDKHDETMMTKRGPRWWWETAYDNRYDLNTQWSLL